MKYGPLIFLAAFFALATSWVTFVFAPQVQVGQLVQTNVLSQSVSYPIARPGVAHEGAEVYRANGCQYCHSQQVGQTGTAFEVSLTDAGTNHPALIAALEHLGNGINGNVAQQMLTGLPKVVGREVNKDEADALAKNLSVGGAKAEVSVVPVGTDIERGWGRRRSVAEDYLYEHPVMLGSRRVGPDLANVGLRLPDVNWHLMHLYWPQAKVKGSTMPSYRFLFETRKIDHGGSPDALVLPADVPQKLRPAAGYEIVPTAEAKALVAYLTSLQQNAPLFDAPYSAPAQPASATTNAPAASGTATNAPSTNAPAK